MQVIYQDGVEPALETYTKTRDNLIKQYGKPSDMGGIQIDPKNEMGTAAFVHLVLEFF